MSSRGIVHKLCVLDVGLRSFHIQLLLAIQTTVVIQGTLTIRQDQKMLPPQIRAFSVRDCATRAPVKYSMNRW